MMNACDRAFQWPMALHLLREMSHQRLQGCQLSMGRWDRDLVLVGYMDPFNGWKLLTRGGYFVIFCGGPGKTIYLFYLVVLTFQSLTIHLIPWSSCGWRLANYVRTQYFFWSELHCICMHLPKWFVCYANNLGECTICRKAKCLNRAQAFARYQSENCICNVHDGWRSRSTSTSWLLHTWHSSGVLTGHMKLPWGILYSNIEYYNIQPWHVPVLASKV